jgi:hypothetical protein
MKHSQVSKVVWLESSRRTIARSSGFILGGTRLSGTYAKREQQYGKKQKA